MQDAAGCDKGGYFTNSGVPQFEMVQLAKPLFQNAETVFYVDPTSTKTDVELFLIPRQMPIVPVGCQQIFP